MGTELLQGQINNWHVIQLIKVDIIIWIDILVHMTFSSELLGYFFYFFHLLLCSYSLL